MYRPLVLLSYAINHAVGAYEPFGYHLLNVLLHAINAGLVWQLARRLAMAPAVALVAALLFVTHPVASETVNYVSSRSTSLATLFVLAAVVAYLDALPRPRVRHHLVLTALSLAALLAKSAGIVVVPLVAVHLLLSRRRAWGLLAGPVVVSAVYLVSTRAIIAKAVYTAPLRSLGVQLATQAKAIPFYLQACLMPVRLSVEPQFSEATGWPGATVLLSLAMIGSLVAAGVLLRRGRPTAIFAAAWVAVTLAPSSLVPLYVLVNEHRLYLPLVGGILLGAPWLAAIGRRHVWIVPVLLLLLAAHVLQRNDAWQSEENIWADAASKGPMMARPHVNLGKAYLEQGRYTEAIAASQRGLEVQPHTARAHYNIGMAYQRLGGFEQAQASYARALEIDPRRVEALNNLGTLYQERREYRRAVEQFRSALRIADRPQIHHNLASAHLAAGQPDSAALHFERALQGGHDERESLEGLARALRADERLQSATTALIRALQTYPGDAELLGLLADTHADLGRDAEALATHRRAGRSPTQAYLALGRAAERRRDWDRARRHYEDGLQAAPEDARLHQALGIVHYSLGDPAAALEALRRAAELDPTLADAFQGIGLVYLRRGRPLEAIAALERARDLEEGGAPRTWELLARAHADAGDTNAAIDAYRKAVAGAPERASLQHNLATLYEAGGHAKEAERLYRAAIDLDPGQLPARHGLGHLLLGQGRYPEAAQAIEQLVALDSTHADAYVNLASAYLNSGREAAAVVAYERYLELHEEDDAMRRKVQDQVRLLRESD